MVEEPYDLNAKLFRLLFYRPKVDGKWIDNAIAIWTRLWNLKAPKNLICSHVEIWIPESNVFVKDGKFVGMCYSSTMGQIRSKNTIGDGVRKAPAADILKHPERWFYCQFDDVSKKNYEQLVCDMEKDIANNQGYDMKLIWSFFWIRRDVDGDKDKYICSEFCFKHFKKLLAAENNFSPMALKKIESLKTSMSPIRGAYTLYNKLGFEFHNLKGA